MSWKNALSKAASSRGKLMEIRVHLSQKKPGSQGVRDFIRHQYASLKEANPTLPFLVREAADVEARLYARYPFGVEHKIPLENLNESEVEAKFKSLTQ